MTLMNRRRELTPAEHTYVQLRAVAVLVVLAALCSSAALILLAATHS